MTDVRLSGCTPEPLASYLTALGVLRMLAEQADPETRGWWDGDAFMLRSRLDAEDLVSFLADEYRPSPVVAPWNGGSGFHPKDNHEAIDAITRSDAPRLAPFREAVRVCRSVLTRLGLAGKPDPERKLGLLEALRSELPDSALPWLDAAVVLTTDSARYPALLGTGGNDGRLDFTNNQMQRLVDVICARDRPSSLRLLRATLLGATEPGLERDLAVGQFHPAAAGGANAGEGFGRESLVNPWSFVLMIEGTLLFAGAATRRWEGADRESFAYPFSVRPTGAGYGSADGADEGNTRCETWVPLWPRPAALREIRSLFGEGRATVGGGRGGPSRNARNGVDFARAVAGLGVDRGIREFVRFGFQERNGLAYMANPLGRWRVRTRPGADLLAGDVGAWIDGLRRQVDDAPASVARAVRRIDAAVLGICRGDDGAAADLLLALGAADQALARSVKFRDDRRIRPVPPLRARDWRAVADDGSAEFGLAWSLASSGMRESLVPVRWAAPWQWQDNDDGRTVWRAGGLVRNLLAVVARDEIDRDRGKAADTKAARDHVERRRRPEGRRLDPRIPGDPARLEDVAAFVQGDLDVARMEALLRGLALIDPASATPRVPDTPPNPACVPFVFALAARAWRLASRPDDPESGFARAPGLVAALSAGDGRRVSEIASRRLRGSGFPTFTNEGADGFVAPADLVRRAGAALAFPVSVPALEALQTIVGAPPKRSEEE